MVGRAPKCGFCLLPVILGNVRRAGPNPAAWGDDGLGGWQNSAGVYRLPKPGDEFASLMPGRVIFRLASLLLRWRGC